MTDMVETAQYIYSLLSRPYTLLTLAFALDLRIGDPKWLPHPVRVIGWFITKIENLLRFNKQGMEHRTKGIKKHETLSGFFLVLVVTGLTYGLFYVINSVLLTSHFLLLTSYTSLIVMIYFISTTLATRELISSVCTIIGALKGRNIEVARKNLRHIVGRDIDSLDEKGMLRATIESLAENASDGIIAPLFYFSLGGLPLAMTYKAINTLDSMVGYKNERYRYFGWAAARLDDIANYIPARITGILIVIASSIVCRSLITVHSSLKTMRNDGRKHPSPNSGMPEAAMAGALGIRLGGTSTYGGIVVEKPYIGEDLFALQEDSRSISTRMSGKPVLATGQGCPDLFSEESLSLIKASEKAISIIKLTSVFGLSLAVIFQYLRISI